MNTHKYISYSLIYGFKEEVVVLSSDLKVVDANEVFLKNNRYYISDVLGKPCHEILHSCNKICLNFQSECPIFEAMTTDLPSTVINSDVIIKNQTKHFKIHVYPFNGINGESLFLHIGRDITDSVEQRRLQESMWNEILIHVDTLHNTMVEKNDEILYLSNRLEQITEIIPLAIVEWDKNGIISNVNHTTEILLGYEKERLIGSPFINLFPIGYDQESFKGVLSRVLKGQLLDYTITDNRTNFGKIIPFEWYHFAVYYGNTLKGGMSIGQDLSEMYALEQERNLLNSQLDLIKELVQHPLIIVNRMLRVIFWNMAAEKEVGWMEREITGREVEILFPGSKRDFILEYLKSILEEMKSGEKKEIELPVLRRDKTTYPALIVFLPGYLDGKPVIAMMVKNLTEQKKIETLLNQSEKMRVLGEMTEGIIHNLNNTLQSLGAGITLIKKMGRDDRKADVLEKLERAYTTCLDKIKKLSEFITPEIKEQEELKLYPIRSLIKDVLEVTRYKWKDIPEKKGINFKISLDIKNLPPILIYPEKFKKALTNLVFNAIESMEKEGGELKIKCFQREQQIVIQIQDDGIGMSSEELKKAFDPYYSTKGVTHAGLGLSIAKRILKDMGGDISLESLKGVGTICTVILPIVTTTVPTDISSEARVEGTLLVIEDDELIRDLLKDALSLAGFNVILCENGRQGIREFKKRDLFDLVITDLGMPFINGLEVAEIIKKQSPKTPIFLITGWITDDHFLKIKPDVIDEIVFKPFDLDKLVNLIKKYLAENKKTKKQ